VQQRRRPRAKRHPARRRRLVELLEQIAEPVGIGERLGQRRQRPLVQSARVALQAERDDAIPLGLVAARALAEHLRVVDLANLEAGPARCGPDAADAAFGDEVFGRARQQQEQRTPVFLGGVAVDRQRADQAFVEQPGELADGGIGTRWSAAVDDEQIGMDGHGDRAGCREAVGRRHDTCHRAPDGRVRAGIQRDRSRGRTAGLGKFPERGALLRRHRLGHRDRRHA
jgi:hypothetical protein